MKIWISRDRCYAPKAIAFWKNKPVAGDGSGDYSYYGAALEALTVREFKVFCGFTPRKGTRELITIKVTRHKETDNKLTG